MLKTKIHKNVYDETYLHRPQNIHTMGKISIEHDIIFAKKIDPEFGKKSNNPNIQIIFYPL